MLSHQATLGGIAQTPAVNPAGQGGTPGCAMGPLPILLEATTLNLVPSRLFLTPRLGARPGLGSLSGVGVTLPNHRSLGGTLLSELRRMEVENTFSKEKCHSPLTELAQGMPLVGQLDLRPHFSAISTPEKSDEPGSLEVYKENGERRKMTWVSRDRATGETPLM